LLLLLLLLLLLFYFTIIIIIIITITVRPYSFCTPLTKRAAPNPMGQGVGPKDKADPKLP